MFMDSIKLDYVSVYVSVCVLFEYVLVCFTYFSIYLTYLFICLICLLIYRYVYWYVYLSIYIYIWGRRPGALTAVTTAAWGCLPPWRPSWASWPAPARVLATLCDFFCILDVSRWAKGCDMEFSRSSKFLNRFFHHKFEISWILDDTFSIHINFFMRIQWNGSRYFIFGYMAR